MSKMQDSKGFYKPFAYPEAYEYCLIQNQIHWLPQEISLAPDVDQWNHALTDKERNTLTHIFRYFTEADREIANEAYTNTYLPYFKNEEVSMMMRAFSNMESIHMIAYSYLLDTLGMPETTYSAFQDYHEMKAKHDYLLQFKHDNPYEVARSIAGFSGFAEGVSLFGMFAVLLNFPRHGLMNGMGQIVSWSVRDESLHCEGMSWAFRRFIEENPGLWNDSLKASIYGMAEDFVSMEDKFFDLAFELGDIRGMTADEGKQYIRHIAGRRLLGLGLKDIFRIERSTVADWMSEQLAGVQHTDFFKTRVIDYAKGAMTGSPADIWQRPTRPSLAIVTV